MQGVSSKLKSELQFFDSTTVRVEQTTRGVRFHARPARSNPPPNPLSHPFKIYQPTNVSTFTTGITFLDSSSGVGTVCNIDATKPTDFTATPPTVNPTTDAWRFWSVRCGQVEVRPIYTLPYYGWSVVNGSYLDSAIDPENWGYKYGINRNTDGVAPYAGKQNFDDPTTETNYPPLIASGNPYTFMGDDALTVLPFFIWIQINQDVDSSSLPTASISCCTGDNPYSEFYGFGGFPDSRPTIIPIGTAWIYPKATSQTYVNQELFDHVRGRFPGSISNLAPSAYLGNGGNGPINFRGIYDDVTLSFTPDDLDQQVFYCGDVITVQSSGVSTGIWQFLGGVLASVPQGLPQLWPDGGPATNGSWTQIF